MPRLCRCALNSADGFSVGIRVRLRASLMLEEEIFPALRLATNEKPKSARVILAPHRTLPLRTRLAFVNLIPAIRAMVNGVKNQALVPAIFRQVRRGEQILCDGQAGMPVF